MAKRSNVVPLTAVRPVQFGQALQERYLSYALSTIMARSLPDVRDGLKPVHRRLLYAMRQLRLDPNSAFKKSARVVGDVIGQYHPHGDQSIYDTLVDMVKAPDFRTGGLLVEPREAIVEAYKTGRGSFRLRARWQKEELARGQYRIIVTEIPYQVQKGKLIERIAEIINAKKLPILEDVRDESADDVRIVLEPRTGNVPAELLMEQLFKQTDLEIRFPLNLNVLDRDNTPRVMDLREALQAFLDHRRDVLVRRSTFRLAEIERRLEILDGYLIAYLNLDKRVNILPAEY